MNNKVFIEGDSLPWEDAGEGVKRKILGYDNNLMMVDVNFCKDSIGYVHAHPHTQVTYVAKGKFEVEIDGQKKILSQGDCFFIPPHAKHGVVCLEEGKLIDVFTPYREDFVNK
jgi:quercetin dioxygenase-like cupin family protein